MLDSLSAVKHYDDDAPALDRLAGAGVVAVVLTNGGGDQTTAILKRAALLNRFERTFSVEEIRAYKPDPRPYRYVLEQLETKPGDATLIAAHGWDVLGAHAVGMDAIWVARLERRWPLRKGCGRELAAGRAQNVITW